MMPSYLAERSTGMPAPRRLSDVASRAELERNRAYVEVLRPSGARHQLTVLASPISLRSTRGWAISRDRAATSPSDALDQARALQPMLALLDRTFDGGRAGRRRPRPSAPGSRPARSRCCGWWPRG